MGGEVDRFEAEMAAWLGVDPAQVIALSSGTDALLLALMAEGIGPGDEVLCPAFTFFATAGCVARLGATPVFADVCPACFNIDPIDASRKVTPRTRAIIPVHLYGQMAPMSPIRELAREHGLALIEDAAQAMGARQWLPTRSDRGTAPVSPGEGRARAAEGFTGAEGRAPGSPPDKAASVSGNPLAEGCRFPDSCQASLLAGQPPGKGEPDQAPDGMDSGGIGVETSGRWHTAGTLGDYGAFSFFPTKNLGAFGDAGALVVKDPDRAHRARVMRVHGMEPKYHHPLLGGNFRMDALQAAILRVKLPHLESFIAARRANAALYLEALGPAAPAETNATEGGGTAGGPGEVLRLPAESSGSFHTWNQFTIRVTAGRRDALHDRLKQSGIGSEVYYPVSLDEQACFAGIGPSGGNPVSHRLAGEVLSLPIFPELAAEAVRRCSHIVNTSIQPLHHSPPQ